MIKPSDISVVVQGPIVGGPDDQYQQRLTYRCLESVRQHLPGAEVVLSTWRDSDVSGLTYDVLVESDDPGAWNWCREWEEAKIDKKLNNGNRQIVCTRAGLRAATRPYAMKLRSDMTLEGTGFLKFFRKYNVRNAEWKILRDRVVASTVYAGNPRRSLRPFHPSDWFFFGWREDVLNIWDIPLAPEPETSRWYDTHPMPSNDRNFDKVHRYDVEQHMWVSFLRKHGRVAFRHKTDMSNDAINLSELTIANNLVLVEPEQLQIKFWKYSLSRLQGSLLYTHGEWRCLYRKYCDSSLQCLPDPVVWHKRAYNILSVPLQASWANKITERWKTVSPASFNAVKTLYLRLFNRNVRV